ncbi:biopolymer transporter ExbD [Candidatus Poribacteria bacterium]|nr:biopolymer transporter ExbD [Candidatus Poribacteria bacterium]
MQQLGEAKLSLMATRIRERKPPTLSMAPMIDCVFLLLIFFMVSTTFTPMPGIRVQLPPPGEPSKEKPKGLVVKIDNPAVSDKAGTMLLNGAVVQFEEMFSLLLNAPQEQKTMLIIQSGREVLHEQIVTVMDTAKEAGIDKIGFAITARE